MITISRRAWRKTAIVLGAVYLLLLWVSHWPSPALLKNPVYSGAFHDAVVLALGEHYKHKDYYRHHLDDLKTSAQWWKGAYVLPRGPCSIDNLERDGIDRADPCRVIQSVYVDDCQNLKGCARFKVDKSILLDPELRRIIISALEDPCRHLLRPADIDPRLHGSAVPGLYYSTGAFPWRIFRCDDGANSVLNYVVPFRHARVTGKVAVDEQAGELRVRFNLT